MAARADAGRVGQASSLVSFSSPLYHVRECAPLVVSRGRILLVSDAILALTGARLAGLFFRAAQHGALRPREEVQQLRSGAHLRHGLK